MAILIAENYTFPVIGYYDENGRGKIKNLYGTASYLKNNIFLTAGHSVENAIKDEIYGIAFKAALDRPSPYIYVKGFEYEIFPDLDLGLIKTGYEVPIATALKWDLEEGSVFEQVLSVGFPHGLDFTNKKFITRGLKGYIVSNTQLYRLKKAPFIYELSFHCPKGISGAALTTSVNPIKIKAFVIGNELTEILAFKETEIDNSGNQKIVYEKYETTKFGIAIQCKNLLEIQSKILGSTFRDYLNRNELI